METKKCTKCKQIKQVNEFGKQKIKEKVYIKSRCKKCKTEDQKKYESKPVNNNKKIAYRRKYYLANKDEINKKNKDWYYKNPSKVKKYIEDNKEQIKRSRDKSREKNKHKYKKTTQAWRVKNKERFNKIQKDYFKEYINSDIYFNKLLITNGFKSTDITKNLIEVKKIIVKTKRLCRTSQS